jgi:hypothetical protein
MSTTAEELKVGNPLPWNVFNRHGQLLLRKGYSVASSRQIKRLYDQGYVSFSSRKLPLAVFMFSARNQQSSFAHAM